MDKLIWTALTTRQAALSEGGALARRFQQDIGPFAAAANDGEAAVAELAALIPQGGDISLLEPSPPAAPVSVRVAFTGAGLQMIARALTGADASFPIEPLGDADAEEMLALATLTRPGPFRTRTHTLGRFLGVRERGRLVAMAGERLQTDEFIEISAVCTHPDHRGRGYGAALMRAVGERILADGKTPFLHTYADNSGAIGLYRSLGFEVRTEVTHAVWRRGWSTGRDDESEASRSKRAPAPDAR